jgi:tetratricopeptide (TPR) repeat protein
MSKPTVFISYSHKDEVWKDKLVSHIGVLQQEGLLDIWDDRRIGAGEDWYPEIQKAIDIASVAILMVSADFLTSKFIRSEEVPKLLERREKEGLHIFPVIVRPCAWKQVKWLSRMNLRPKDGEPISGGTEFQIDADMAAIAEEIAGIIERTSRAAQVEGSVPLAPEKISLAKLPSTNPELFGRANELKMLDDTWENPKINIVTLVAWGGVGKTALVNSWLCKMRTDNFRGAERVFGWSFYSQGASEGKQTSADYFIAAALKWFGDPEPDKGSPWEKGERLAELIKKQKTLLILDGLEPLQNPPGERGGRIKDAGLQCLVKELAYHNPGLCVVTTRIEVEDIEHCIGNSAQSIPLDNLSPDAGKELLERLGVKGTSDELMQASIDFGNHALALTLLGNYLAVVYDGEVRRRGEIGRLTDEEEHGGHAKRVMKSYEEWFKGKPELNILYIMGLFDRPAEAGAIQELKFEPVINGLTSDLQGLSSKDWRYALNRLRKAGLLADEDGEQDKLDGHPLIREYFGEKLKKDNPEAWKEAHSRLYEYYRDTTKEWPDSIEEMMPLYAAVSHGCQAGRYQEVLDEVYWPRIKRRSEHFSTTKLGAISADLAAISGFFEELWSKPTSELTEAAKGFILSEAGFALRALGRVVEAGQIMKANLDANIAQKNWKAAAITAGNLSELSLTMGDIALALKYAERCVDLADRSGDAYMRLANRTVLADSLHQVGNLSEAEASFQEAEKMLFIGDLKNEFHAESILFGIWGFRYHDLLLSIGEYPELLKRENQIKDFQWDRSLLDIALDHLSMGRALLLRAVHKRTGDFTQAEKHLNQAVDGLRKSGQQDDLPRGLIARAELYRVQGTFNKAQHDLDEATTIAERGSMGLYQADCHLGYARLFLAMGEKEKTPKELGIAKEMIGKMGYHRRDGEVKELEEQLK